MVQDDGEMGAAERACANCGHGEGEHAVQEAEVSGNTVRRMFCESCEDAHDFLPEPLDL
ncbi:MAG: hypothetical protein WD800_07355 [Dehalococcoidia bacterium]